MNAILWSQLLDAEGLLSALPTGIIATTKTAATAADSATTKANSASGSAMLGMWGNSKEPDPNVANIDDNAGSAPTSTITTDASCGKAFV